MTTTPDSRIRADWTLPAETAAPPPTLGAIDTSTTAGKISVMAAYNRGEAVQARHLGLAEWSVPKTRNDAGDDPCWDWSMYDYRIAPPPVSRSALQAARRHRSEWKGAHNPDSLHLEPLLREIDNSVLVEVSPCDGSTKMHSFVAMTGPLAPGRYRLVRDDQ